MVTKSPKKPILGKRELKKRPVLRVHIEKLSDRDYQTYRNRPSGTSGSPIPVKEERSCVFSSEVDLTLNARSPIETSVTCRCNYCSNPPEMKLQYKQYLEAAVDQENAGFAQPYLCDVVQTAQPNAYVCGEARAARPVVRVVEKRSASTQTAPRVYKFTCECGSQFNDQHYFDAHKLVHASFLYECAFCNATSENEKQMQSHMLLHSYKNIYECLECKCAFADRKEFMKHSRTHTKAMFGCGDCKAQFMSEKALKHHEKTHVSSGQMIHVFVLSTPAQCEPTRELAVVENEANVYEEPPKNGPRFFECTLCNLQFTNVGSMSRHNVIHTRSAAKFLHVCTVCGGRFRSNNHLVGHQRHAHKA